MGWGRFALPNVETGSTPLTVRVCTDGQTLRRKPVIKQICPILYAVAI